MAFRKFANAALVKTGLDFHGWDDVLRSSSETILGSGFEARKASRVILQEYQPNDFLLTHVTIMASVDVENGPGKIGTAIENGFEVRRKWPEYYITPNTSRFVNHNGDAWSRAVLLNSYRTFIGADNFCEHIQIKEMSKGRIIDAAARDIGDSIYIDLLVATARKHKPLIAAITGGQLNTLSMGCTVKETQCTKCGNVAEDETQLCNCVRYSKRNNFLDDLGKQRIIAELCGHSSEPDSVRFIEASWVANPAFKGAVLRSILTEREQEMAGIGHKVAVAFSTPSPAIDPDLMSKAAYAKSAQGQEGEGTKKEDDDPVTKAVGDLVDLLREKAIEKVRGEINKDDTGPVDENRNDSLIKSAIKHPTWAGIGKAVIAAVGKDHPALAKKLLLGMVLYRSGGWGAVNASRSFTGRELLALSRLLDTAQNKRRIAGENRLYKVVLAVGGLSKNADEKSYLRRCREVMGRDITDSERTALLTKGRLYALGL